MKRRMVMLGGAAAMGVVAFGIAARPGDRAIVMLEPLKALQPSSFAVLVHLAARVLAGSAADPLQTAHRVDAAIAFGPKRTAAELHQGLLLLENALPRLLSGHAPTPFSLLTPTDQDEAFSSWRDGSINKLRGAYNGLRKLILAAHYATPAGYADAGCQLIRIASVDPGPLSARGSLLAAPTEVMP
jgi:hypothetical protein